MQRRRTLVRQASLWCCPDLLRADTQNNSPKRGDFLVNEDVVSHVGSATPRSRAISKPPHVHPALLELTVNSHIKFSSCAVSTFHKYRYRFPKGVRLRAQVAPRHPHVYLPRSPTRGAWEISGRSPRKPTLAGNAHDGAAATAHNGGDSLLDWGRGLGTVQ